MSNTSLQKKLPTSLKEKGQYAMVFGIVTVMLYVAGFPVFLLLFVGVLTFFIWKVFSSEGRNETRRIFEFYLAANEILRDDERRWYGFEIRETIDRGEAIARSMTTAPPLVHFGLGALYQKLNDHSSAVQHLARVVDGDVVDEGSIVFPGKDLREYVRMLRKIERSPAEAPQTSKAVRSLERSRKNRAKDMLQQSRLELSKPAPQLSSPAQVSENVIDLEAFAAEHEESSPGQVAEPQPVSAVFEDRSAPRSRTVARAKREKTGQGERQTISEVLHEIYDRT